MTLGPPSSPSKACFRAQICHCPTDCAANSAVKMAAPLAPSNLRPDSMTPAGATYMIKSYRLIDFITLTCRTINLGHVLNSHPVNWSEEKAKKRQKELWELPWGSRLRTVMIQNIRKKSANWQVSPEASSNHCPESIGVQSVPLCHQLVLSRCSRQYKVFSKRPKTV